MSWGVRPCRTEDCHSWFVCIYLGVSNSVQVEFDSFGSMSGLPSFDAEELGLAIRHSEQLGGGGPSRMEVIRRRGQEEQGCVPPATGLGLYVKDISGQTQLDPVPLPDSAQEGEIAALGVVPPKAPSLLRIRRKVGGDDHPGACMVIKQEVTPSSQRAFTKLCQATTSEYPAQKMPGTLHRAVPVVL